MGTLFKHGHESAIPQIKAQERHGTDYDKIEQQRAEIKAMKEKKRILKETGEIDEDQKEKLEESHNQWKDTHEKQAKVIKADNSKWDNDWDKIEQQRAEIKAIKEKQRIAKLEAEENGVAVIDEETKHKIEESHNKWKDTHEKQAKVIKADNSKWDNDWSKIEKQRAEIKAIKEKKRLSKMQSENQLLERNKAKKDTSKKFHNASHEKAPKKQAA